LQTLWTVTQQDKVVGVHDEPRLLHRAADHLVRKGVQPIQMPVGVGQFQRGNRIGIARRLGLLCDPGHRRPRLGQPRVKGGTEIPIRNLGKGRKAKWRGPGGKQRIGHVENSFMHRS
jgi:hypothetical protein